MLHCYRIKVFQFSGKLKKLVLVLYFSEKSRLLENRVKHFFLDLLRMINKYKYKRIYVIFIKIIKAHLMRYILNATLLKLPMTRVLHGCWCITTFSKSCNNTFLCKGLGTPLIFLINTQDSSLWYGQGVSFLWHVMMYCWKKWKRNLKFCVFQKLQPFIPLLIFIIVFYFWTWAENIFDIGPISFIFQQKWHVFGFLSQIRKLRLQLRILVK